MPYKDPQKQKESQQRYYLANKGGYRESFERRKNEYWRIVGLHLLSNPCVDCGETDPVILEFDHRDPSDKLYNIADFRTHRIGPKKLREEISKCDVRCANCHRRRTAKQFGYENKYAGLVPD